MKLVADPARLGRPGDLEWLESDGYDPCTWWLYLGRGQALIVLIDLVEALYTYPIGKSLYWRCKEAAAGVESFHTARKGP